MFYSHNFVVNIWQIFYVSGNNDLAPKTDLELDRYGEMYGKIQFYMQEENKM